MKILTLNKYYAPIRLCGWRSAICKLYGGAAKAVEVSDGVSSEYDWDEWLMRSLEEMPAETKFVQTASQRVAIPSIIRCVRYDRAPNLKLRPTRRAIFERDNHTCYLCGKEFGDDDLTVDHLTPKSKGGPWSWENLVTCCKKCNNKKGDKTLKEFGAKPKFLPRAPIAAALLFAGDGPEEWKTFGV